MSVNQNEYNALIKQLNKLLESQRDMQDEVADLQRQIDNLTVNEQDEDIAPVDLQPVKKEFNAQIEEVKQEAHQVAGPIRKTQRVKKVSVQKEIDFEKLIGENIANKIGILILIFGAGIGVKYAIDRELISPLARIILGYLLGFGLLFFAFRLLPKYKQFSAVLLSGSMAIMYFVTFTAYNLYGILPHYVTFLLMVIFTIFTVLSSLKYDNQIIALIGLVGAYAVPYLLGIKSGEELVLFSFIALINLGILFIAVKKYWKPLYYSAFVITWTLFVSRYFFKDEYDNSSILLGFNFIYFLTFYLTFLAYKIYQKETFNKIDIFFVLLNSFVFYLLGIDIVSNFPNGSDYHGLFTILNAIIHFSIGVWVYNQKLVDKKILYLILALGLTFVTIAIPVQLSGSWVVFLWAVEAALLFWIARTKRIQFFEYFAYALMILAIFSISNYWDEHKQSSYAVNIEGHPFFFNSPFLVSLIFTITFGWITYVNYATENFGKKVNRLFNFIIPTLFLFALYRTFYNELYNLFTFQHADALRLSEYSTSSNNILLFRTVWVKIYSLFFISLISFVSHRKFKNKILYTILSIITILIIVSSINIMFDSVATLRQNYVSTAIDLSFMNIGIRYILILMVGVTLYMLFKNIRIVAEKRYDSYFELFVYIVVLALATSELMNFLDLFSLHRNQAIWIDILWGIYALMLIAIGIKQKKAHLRILAIIIFGVTLIKLFFLDFYLLDNLAKTIVLISLGILLLVISFLYNRFKSLIEGDA